MARLQSFYVAGSVVVTGAVVMALEFVGARMLSPRWGDALPVWGATIATVLGAMSLGYVLGGRLADRRPRLSTLVSLLALSGAVVFATALSAEGLLDQLRAATAEPRVGALLGSLLVCAPGAFLLACISPMALKLQLDQADHTQSGRRAGELYALGTAGSIVGSLASTFLLIETLGLLRLLLLMAATLWLLAALGTALARHWVGMGLAVCAAAVAVSLSGAGFGTGSQIDRLDQSGGTVRTVVDSAYHRVVVSDLPGGLRQMSFNSWPQSQQRRNNPSYPVYDYMQSAVRTLCYGRPRNIALIGVAGGSYVQLVRVLQPQAKLVAADIDPEVLEVSKRWFDLPQSPQVKYLAQDGRQMIADQPDGSLDLIYVDAYSRDDMPEHLATREFYQLAARKLKPQDLYSANVIAKESSPLSGAIYNTLGSAFPQAQLFDAQPHQTPGYARNQLAVAGSKLEPDPVCLRRAEQTLKLPSGLLDLRLTRPGSGPVLTDNQAPIEQLKRQ